MSEYILTNYLLDGLCYGLFVFVPSVMTGLTFTILFDIIKEPVQNNKEMV